MAENMIELVLGITEKPTDMDLQAKMPSKPVPTGDQDDEIFKERTISKRSKSRRSTAVPSRHTTRESESPRLYGDFTWSSTIYATL